MNDYLVILLAGVIIALIASGGDVLLRKHDSVWQILKVNFLTVGLGLFVFVGVMQYYGFIS